MRVKTNIVVAVLLAFFTNSYSQNCTNLGQTPETAFPVCGTGTFNQSTVPLCGVTPIPTSCAGGVYQNRNPYWYRFTCFAAGTLGFVLDPINNNDDYDWIVFDITGHVPSDVFTIGSLSVAENWSAITGNTGASNNTNGLVNCAGGFPNFSSMPTLIVGHEYLLMVSNWSASQQGYTLTFTGGTAGITDPLQPALAGATVDCGGQSIHLLFNKQMKCNSLAANGTDFILSPLGSVVSNAGLGCTSSFDMDSAALFFNAPLPPGNYTLSMTNGLDGNTLLDNCGTPIALGNSITFTIPPRPPIPTGTVTADPSGDCNPIRIKVIFPEAVMCASAALDGSDFLVTGPSPVTVSAIIPVCTSGETDGFTVQFTAPITVPGTYTVQIVTGSDGNTILNRCNGEVPVGSTAQFTVAAQAPIPMGNITVDQCAPASLTLNFADPLQCSSVATDGSDFIVTGSSTVAVASATPLNCNNGETNSLTLQFASPIFIQGNYQVEIANGSDGNTLIGECSRVVLSGSNTSFTLDPQPPIPMGNVSPTTCTPSTITLSFSEPVNCNSIATDGSDFVITGPSTVTVSSATAINCTNGETNTITIQFSSPILASGDYEVAIQNGTDGNTLYGACGKSVSAGSNAIFNVPVQPSLPMGAPLQPLCAPTSIEIDFPEAVNCSSISADGSEFIITGPSNVTIVSATGNCGTASTTNRITLQFASPIAVSGTYHATLQNGSDGDTYVGDCNRVVPIGSMAIFTIPDAATAIMDSIVPIACSPSTLSAVFDIPVRCSSIASDGTDFTVTGPSTVTISSATGVCDASGFTRQINIQLLSPIVAGGNYQLQLKTGSDGNTVLSECYRETPVTSLNFTASDTVSAEFQYQVAYDCETDAITFSHDGQHNVNEWRWIVNGVPESIAQSFSKSFSSSGQNQVSLSVSNGLCTDSYTTDIILNNKIVADFETPDMICPGDTAKFIDKSTGLIDNWLWSFGNGNTSSLPSPLPQIYPTTGTETLYNVSLTVSNNNFGCNTTATKTIKVLGSCIIAVPTAFTPNNDGLNDFLYPLNAFKAEHLDFKVFNRWGQLVFYTNDWTQKWDGKINGIQQVTDVYVWTLSYTHRDTGVKYSLRGTTTLIR